MIEEHRKAKGELTCWLLDKYSLQILQKVTVRNLITTYGDKWLASRCVGSGNQLSDIAVGTGTTAPTVDDTGLETQLDKNALMMTPWQGSGSDGNKFYCRALFDTSEAVGTLAEAGLFDGTYLFSRVLISPTINKTSDKVLVCQWTITF